MIGNMSTTATTTNGHPERLPDLTREEVAALTEWGRRVKGTGDRIELVLVGGDLAAVTVERGDVERA